MPSFTAYPSAPRSIRTADSEKTGLVCGGVPTPPLRPFARGAADGRGDVSGRRTLQLSSRGNENITHHQCCFS